LVRRVWALESEPAASQNGSPRLGGCPGRTELSRYFAAADDGGTKVPKIAVSRRVQSSLPACNLGSLN
jgi:hypothetical protein